ncbi:MAG: PepSY domain-containing protein [Chloroflexota bacterium]|nr:PepSY domain-containing protein [Chloroflexota bacterium]
MMEPGTGGGVTGGWGGYNPQAKTITPDQAADAARRYLNAYYGQRLSLAEVMEFAENFYAEVEEKDTSTHALELLIDKYTGQVYPEMGPNMMWNAKYGMMTSMMGGYYPSRAPSAPMSVTPEQAKALAQQFLDARLPGLTVADADTFYGYYTLHTLKGGQVEGMLSVNGYTGAVWYHTWHGPFISLKELKV